MEPSNGLFFFTVCTKNSPHLLEHREMHSPRCSGAAPSCTVPKETHFACVTEGAAPAGSDGAPPRTSASVRAFLSAVCPPALYYESSWGNCFVSYKWFQKQEELQLELVPCSSAQQCTVIKSCLEFVLLLFSYPVK